MTEREIKLNKQYRAQIMRIMAAYYPASATAKQIRYSLLEYGLTNPGDISKHLYYLRDKGYIRYSDGSIRDIDDSEPIFISSSGIDLVEGTITDDGLYM